MLFNVEPGEKKQGCAGGRRGTVTLSVSEDGNVATINDERFAISKDVLVYWHSGSAGTWHGLGDPETLKTEKPNEYMGLTMADMGLLGGGRTSTSGGGAYAGMVMKIDRPVAIVTSGYNGRGGWCLSIFEPSPDGVRFVGKFTTIEYRAKYAPVQQL